jgi:hypothetical protein
VSRRILSRIGTLYTSFLQLRTQIGHRGSQVHMRPCNTRGRIHTRL